MKCPICGKIKPVEASRIYGWYLVNANTEKRLWFDDINCLRKWVNGVSYFELNELSRPGGEIGERNKI